MATPKKRYITTIISEWPDDDETGTMTATSAIGQALMVMNNVLEISTDEAEEVAA